MAKKIQLTYDEVSNLIGELAGMEMQLSTLTAKQDKDLDAVRARYEEKISSLSENISTIRKALQKWGKANTALFEEKKHLEFPRGFIRLFSGHFKVETRKGFTWKQVVDTIVKLSQYNHCYLRWPDPVVNKEAILEDRDTLPEEELEKMGIDIVQDESITIETKKEELELQEGAA